MILRFDDEISKRLIGLSNGTDRSKAYLVTQALKLFLDNNEQQVQERTKTVVEADAATPDQFVDHDNDLESLRGYIFQDDP